MRGLSGRMFVIGFAVVIACVAALGYFTLRNASKGRFAISVHMIPESPHADQVSLGNPIVVRIDKRSAGRSPLLAMAMLLEGNGRQLSDLRPLDVRQEGDRKKTEEVVFPPLTALPAQRLLAAIVIRSPASQLDVLRMELARIQHAPSSLPQVFGEIFKASRKLGGHAELVQVEVRDKL